MHNDIAPTDRLVHAASGNKATIGVVDHKQRTIFGTGIARLIRATRAQIEHT